MRSYGYKKQGVGFGYTKQRGYHPLLASRADTGEVLHVRLRKGQANTQRGVLRFAEELIARVARAGATGEKLLRADSAFWNKKLIARLESAGWLYSISVRMQFWVTDAIARSPRQTGSHSRTTPQTARRRSPRRPLDGRRLIVRRTRLIGPQAELWPDWRYFPFLTNRTDPLEVVEAEHRQHAVVELTIRDLKDQALAHFPSGQFNANSAWTVIACHRAQPAPLDQRDRTARPDRPRRAHAAPPAASDPRPPDPHRPPVDASPPRPLALARRLHQRASPASAALPALT